ncbi:hypothetical protein IWZ00DRAFT_118342 [Phyllosticta capitalensis]
MSRSGVSLPIMLWFLELCWKHPHLATAPQHSLRGVPAEPRQPSSRNHLDNSICDMRRARCCQSVENNTSRHFNQKSFMHAVTMRRALLLMHSLQNLASNNHVGIGSCGTSNMAVLLHDFLE